VHWGILRHPHKETGARPSILLTAIVLDAVVLAAFVYIKGTSDLFVIYTAIIGLAVIFAGERFFLRRIA
jgi:hypothetical protein